MIRVDKIQRALLTGKVEGEEEEGDLGEHGLMISSSRRKGA